MNDTDRPDNPPEQKPDAAEVEENVEGRMEPPTAEAEDAERASDEPANDETVEVNLGAKMLEAEKKAQENWDQFLRAKAELDNVRRRAERDVANAHKYALEKFATELLAVVDSLELGLKAADGDGDNTPDVASVAEGMRLTHKMLTGTLEKFSVTAIDPEGQPFNPEEHEAMSMVPNPDVAPNTVVAVMQKGYKLNERVIRPAMVVVSQAADS